MDGVELHGATTRISECSACETQLPLCEAVDPDDARIWLCSLCGTEYRAMLASDYSIDELRGVRPEPVIFDPQSIQPIAPEVVEFAQQLDASRVAVVEKRSSTRHPVVAMLKVMELDAQLHAVGPAFHAICRNLSTGGICLINDCAVPSKFLVIELSAAQGLPIQALAHVLRRRPLGPYHELGCAFVTKLANPSLAPA